MLASIKSLALMALASSVAQAAVVTYNWNISYVNTNADGLFERRVIGVNGQFPYVLLLLPVDLTIAAHLDSCVFAPTPPICIQSN